VTATAPVPAVRTVQVIAEAIRTATRCAEHPGGASLTRCDVCLTLAATRVLSVLKSLHPKRQPLTLRQREILDFITLTMAERRIAPSFEEIAKHFGFRSLATVFEHLDNLVRKGYLIRYHNEARAIMLIEEPV
jgi:DNA-binding MarR family transcriptional regulator